MLAAIRAFSKSWVAIVLFMLLLVSLIVWGGMGNMLKNPVSSGVITVGSHSVSPGEFENQFTRQLEQIGQQQGGPPPHAKTPSRPASTCACSRAWPSSCRSPRR